MIRGLIAAALVLAQPASAGVIVGSQLDVQTGSLVIGRPVANETFSLDAAVGLGATLGYSGRIFSIAFAPHYIPNHHLEIEQGADLKQLDLGVQLGIHNAIAHRVELVGAVTPAYSRLSGGGMTAATGLAMTFSAGPLYVVSRRVQVGATISYQYGAQHADDSGLILATRLVALGVFVTAR